MYENNLGYPNQKAGLQQCTEHCNYTITIITGLARDL